VFNTAKKVVSGLENKTPMLMDPTTIQKIVRGEMNSELIVLRMNGTNPEIIHFSVLEKEMKAFWSRVPQLNSKTARISLQSGMCWGWNELLLKIFDSLPYNVTHFNRE
jgi:hypothetical protein